MSFAHQSGAGGVTVHGLLSGLDADDHLWAARADKTRPDPWVEAADLAGRSLADLGTRLHSDLNNFAYADAGHTGFCSLATAQTIEAQKLIDSAVGLRFGHAAGPLLQGPASGDDLSLTGDLALSGNLALGGGTINAGRLLAMDGVTDRTTLTCLHVAPTLINPVSSVFYLNLNPSTPALLSGGSVVGLNANAGASLASGAASGYLRGLNFSAPVSGGGAGAVLTEATAQRLVLSVAGFSGTIAAMRGVSVITPTISSSPSAVITEAVGVDIGNMGNYSQFQTSIGLRIADITNATNRYLIQAGPATPNLRLLANAPPNAALTTEGDSQLYLAWMENGAVNLRQVRWRAFGSLIGTERMLIAA